MASNIFPSPTPPWIHPEFAESLPAKQIAWQTFRIDRAGGNLHRKSMLTSWELQLLSWHARHVNAPGDFVDLGPLTGLSTIVLCDALLKRPDNCGRRVYSYDLFLVEPYFRDYVSTKVGHQTGSLFPEFLELSQPYRDFHVICPGDLLKMRWDSGPIALLFVDIAKSWALMRHVFQQFFPRLTPGSIVVHQDYIWHTEWWIMIYMSWLRDYFEPIDYAYGATCVFRCLKPVPPAFFDLDPEQWDKSQWKSLFEPEIDRHPDFARKTLMMATAQMHAAIGEADRARHLLHEISQMPRHERSPWHDFDQTPLFNLESQLNRIG